MRNKGEERRKIDEIRKKTIEKNRKGKGKKGKWRRSHESGASSSSRKTWKKSAGKCSVV